MKKIILPIVFALLFITGAYSQSMIVDSTVTIKVSFTGTHTWVSDLGFYLLAPGYGPGQTNQSTPGNYGTVELLPSINAWNDGITTLPSTVIGCSVPSEVGTNCNSGDNFTDFNFTSSLPSGDPAYTACVCDLPAPLTGTFASAGTWSTIYGFDAYTQGWGVQVYDCVAMDVGYLTSATIYFIKGADTVKYITPVGVSEVNDGACDFSTASYFQLFLETDPCNMFIEHCIITNCSAAGVSDGAIDINVLGGTLPYIYNWSNGATTADLTNIPEGEYTVQIMDSTGACFLSGTYIVGVNNNTGGSGCQALYSVMPDSIQYGQPGPYAFFDNSFNSDSSAINVISWTWTITGNGMSSTLDQQNPVVYFNNPGVYDICLTINTEDSCSSTYCNSITISGTNPCNLTATYNTVMPSGSNTSDGAIYLAVAGGTPPYYFSWNTGVTTQDLTNIPYGYYEVYIYDAMQCSLNFPIYLIDSTNTGLSASVLVNNDSEYGVCDGSVMVYPDGGTPPYQYIWSNGATTQFIDSLCMGYYEVTIYDAMQDSIVTGGYVYYDSTNVNCYAYFIPSSQTIQLGESVSFTNLSDSLASAWSWSFYGGTPSTSTLQNPSNIAFNTIGAFSVCLTITTANGCSSSYCDQIYVTNDSVIVDSCNIFIAGVITNCSNANTADGAIDITVYNTILPIVYTWTGNGVTYNTEDLYGVPSGSYSVVVTDANGCLASSTFYVAVDTINCSLSAYYNVTPVSYIGATDGGIDVTVYGETNPVSYLWSNGATSQDLVNIPSGTYSVTITDSNPMCQSLVLFANIYEPYDPNGGQVVDSLYTNSVDTCFDAYVDSFYVAGVNVNTNNTINVNWVFVTATSTYTITVSYSCNASGNYVIYLTVNCEGAKNLTTYMSYIHVETTTVTPIFENTEKFILYPNPVNDVLNVDFSKNMNVNRVEVYNLNGQLIFSDKVNSVNNIRISTLNFEHGVYIIRLSSPTNTFVDYFVR